MCFVKMIHGTVKYSTTKCPDLLQTLLCLMPHSSLGFKLPWLPQTSSKLQVLTISVSCSLTCIASHYSEYNVTMISTTPLLSSTSFHQAYPVTSGWHDMLCDLQSQRIIAQDIQCFYQHAPALVHVGPNKVLPQSTLIAWGSN